VRAGPLLSLAWRGLAADPRRAVLDALACCAGAAALVFFVALGLGTGEATRRLFPGEARVVEVVPSNVSLGPLLGAARLDDAALARIAAVPGVAAVHGKLDLKVPLTASRAPEGLDVHWPPALALQIPVVGVPPALLAADLAPGAPAFEDPGPGGAIPIVLARRLLDVYNGTIAPSWNARQLPPGPALVGLELPVQAGQSILLHRTEKKVEPLRLVLAGFSDRVPLYAAAMPIQAVRRLHREWGKSAAEVSRASVIAAAPEDVPAVAAAVRRMGLAVDESERAMAERIGSVVALAGAALTLVALVVCGLAGIAVAQSLFGSVRARAKELAVLRAVGAAAGDVRALVLAEAALLGLAGGVVGTLLARAAAVGADGVLARALPESPLRPDTLFLFPPWLWALGVAVALLAALAGALAPAALAARLDPARALA
jgi:hypothetical protein